jgi:hypothetical protein
VLSFARALGQDGELGDVARVPVTFPIAVVQFDPRWPLRPRPGQPWAGSGRSAGERRSGGGPLHAEQEFEYRRPLRVGEVLRVRTVPGRTWQKEGRRGTLRFTERVSEYVDEGGELVIRATTVAVRTEKGEAS